jgi:putative transposase
MIESISFAPGRTIRWRKRRFVVVDCTGFDTLIAREIGKRRFERIPVAEARPDRSIPHRSGAASNLVSVPDEEWQAVVEHFAILRPLLEMDVSERSRADVEKVAKILDKHPATIYRWIDAFRRSGRVSALLRKGRSDRGRSRLSSRIDTIIEDAIKRIYLTPEQPPETAVIEEVNLQCFNAKLKAPSANTVRRRIGVLSDRLKFEKRVGKKAAAEKYEPIKGHFPGAASPLAVAQIDHTRMDVIVVDEEHRQPIQRPWLTVVIDIYSRMVLGFTIYLEKPSAFTTGLQSLRQYCQRRIGSLLSAYKPSGRAGERCAQSTATMQRNFVAP